MNILDENVVDTQCRFLRKWLRNFETRPPRSACHASRLSACGHAQAGTRTVIGYARQGGRRARLLRLRHALAGRQDLHYMEGIRGIGAKSTLD